MATTVVFISPDLTSSSKRVVGTYEGKRLITNMNDEKGNSLSCGTHSKENCGRCSRAECTFNGRSPVRASDPVLL